MMRSFSQLFVLLFLTGPAIALAGTTSFTPPSPIKYAIEVSSNSDTYKLPASGTVIARTMSVIPSPGNNFLVDVILSDGATWDVSNPYNAEAELTLRAGFASAPISVGNRGGASTLSYLVKPINTSTEYPSFVLTYNSYRIKDPANRLGAGGTIQITVQTRDAATGALFDVGNDTVSFLIAAYGVQVDKALAQGKATIDLGTDRYNFVGGIRMDNTPSITINGKIAGVYDRNCNQYQLLATDNIDFVISGNLSGIYSIEWGGVTKYISATDIAGGTATLSLPGNHPSILNAVSSNFTLTVTGNTALSARTLTLSVKLVIGYYPANSRSLVPSRTLFTVWDLNGTMLTANWVNGNSGMLNSRIYLWNPSDMVGKVVIQVYTLPIGPSGSTSLGTLDWGALPAYSGANIRVAEDILVPLGIKLPYTDNSGNLVLVMTTAATGVFGVTQTFSNSMSFGTYALRESAPK